MLRSSISERALESHGHFPSTLSFFKMKWKNHLKTFENPWKKTNHNRILVRGGGDETP